MSESDPRSPAHWLAQGLAYLDAGERERAADCWQHVLEIEPGHQGALDCLASLQAEADGDASALETDPIDAGDAQDDSGTAGDLLASELREEALELLAGGLVDDAYQLLTTTPSDGSAELESLALIELLRTHLVDDVLLRLGSSSAVPVVEIGPKDLMKFNLPPGAGFLLSRIDGQTPVDDLVAVSGMDPFETFHTLGRLLEAGIVGVAE